jgi:hypothetical protein
MCRWMRREFGWRGRGHREKAGPKLPRAGETLPLRRHASSAATVPTANLRIGVSWVLYNPR